MSVRSALAWMGTDTSRALPGTLARWLACGLNRLALAALIATVFSLGYWRPLIITFLPQGWISPQYAPLLTVSVSDLSAIITFILWLIARSFAALTRQERAPLRLSPIALTLPLPGLAALSALSARQAIFPVLSDGVALDLVVLTAFVIAFLNLRPPVWAIVVPLALLLAIEGVLALTQVRAQSTLFGNFLYGWDYNFIASRPGASVVQLPDGTRWLRGYGTYPNPNILGGFLCLAIPLVASLCLRLPWRSLGRWALLAALALGLLALLLSFSRAAWLGVLAGALWAALLFWLRRRSTRSAADPGAARARQHGGWRYKPALLALLGVGLLVGLVAAFGPILQSRLLLDNSALEQRSVNERVVLLKASAVFFLEHPWLGVGAGNMPYVELSYPATQFIEQPVHNVPILVGVETGIFGLLLWLIPPIMALWAAWRRRFTLSPAGLAASAALVAVLVPAQLDHYFWSTPIGRQIFWVAIALTFLWCQQER